MIGGETTFAVSVTLPVSKLCEWGEPAAKYFEEKSAAAKLQEDEADAARAAAKGKGGFAHGAQNIHGIPLSSYYKGIAVRVRGLLIAFAASDDEIAKVPLSLVTLLSTPAAWDEMNAVGLIHL